MEIILVDSIYKRIESGLLFDNNLRPYSKEFLDKLLKFYESNENYEKCALIRNIINDRFTHEKLFISKRILNFA